MSNNIWNNDYNPFQFFKTLAWYDRMKCIRTGNFAPPVNIALDITQGTQDKKKCGAFHCNFCMSNLEEVGHEAILPGDVLLAIPKFYNEWGVKSICVAGHHSDPCLYNHDILIGFLRLCNKYNVEVGFVSNGAYYSEYLIEEVARTCNWSGWSINAGTAEDHKKITGTDTFGKIIRNLRGMYEYTKSRNISHDIGYKYLITDDNYTNILKTIEIASKIGVRHMQIRPTELPIERSEKIDVQLVEDQIREGLKYERPGEFEVFGIREKFKADFTKNPPKRCIASPLGSTWKADGEVVICPDRRFSSHLPNMVLGNFVIEGLEAIRRQWGGPKHKKMIDEANEHLHECIRCTAFKWHELYENVIENDTMDVKLI